jgi:hypothetical protein
MTADTIPESIGADLLQGADAIAKFLGCSRRRVYHLGGKGGWPIFNDGSGKIMARKSALIAFIADREREAIASRRTDAGRTPAAY